MTKPHRTHHTERMAIRTFHHDQFDPAALVAAKAGRVISVVIPARDEESTVGAIVAAIRSNLVDEIGLVDDLVVIDDRSTDGTAARAHAAGAAVFATSDVLPHLPPARGKGEALWKGLAAATGDIVAFVDGDVEEFDFRFVTGLLGPVLSPGDGGEVAFVKAFYERPIDGRRRGGGRVTELAARPIISLLHPHLSSVVQPLSGEFAAPRAVLETLPFVHGYGVDIGLLVDFAAAYGTEALAQVDLGRRVHRNRPIDELGPMAAEVLQTALHRGGVKVPRTIRLDMPDLGEATITLAERPPLRDVGGRD